MASEGTKVQVGQTTCQGCCEGSLLVLGYRVLLEPGKRTLSPDPLTRLGVIALQGECRLSWGRWKPHHRSP